MPAAVPHRFHIVDVFAEALYAGNTLAVVRDAADLDTETMQRIAREFGFSETTFVTSPPDGASVAVRIFTPAEELPFAGHPTLGTACAIREHLRPDRPAEVTLALGVGPVPVAFEADAGGAEVAWLTAPRVTLGRTLDPERIAPALGLRLARHRARAAGPASARGRRVPARPAHEHGCAAPRTPRPRRVRAARA